MARRPEAMVCARRVASAAVFLFAAWGWASASWAWPMDPTQEELALLPPYCPHTLDSYGPSTPEQHAEQRAKWESVYGEAFIHFHHYCYSFVYSMRADRYSVPASLRQTYLGDIVREIQYVIDRTPRDHPLRPEMFTRQGTALRRLGKADEAIRLFKKASELDPTYWHAYYEMAICYLARNRKDQAREALREGLSHAPDAKALVSMLNELSDNAQVEPRAPKAAPGARSAPRSGDPQGR